MAELLLEILSEEIPARMQAPIAVQLRELFAERLQKETLFAQNIKTFVTPRRLVLTADGMSLTQEDKTEERKGPRTDAPKTAIQGFLQATGLKQEQLEVRRTDKGEFYFAVMQRKGKKMRELLTDILQDVLLQLSWPKSMRWGSNTLRWVRPVKNIACVFGGEVLPVQLGHIVANDNSSGHRFLSPQNFRVQDFKQYREQLHKQKVVLDSDERKALIWAAAEDIAAQHKLQVQEDKGLLDEVAGLVEYPVVLLGKIDTTLMNIPEEVLISAVRTHQKYFVLRNKKGHLAPYFLIVANMETRDNGAAIIAGNERVLRARLSDAAFFWTQDRKKPLQEWAKGLDKVVFHAKLGTMAEKVTRMTSLAQLLDVWVPHANFGHTERAAQLCKADLVTGMVGEFPELQGIMGAYYALEQGETQEIAEAIGEHYSPLGPTDAVPAKPISISIALADKIDTLVGMFAANEKPTSSKDPFALRRAALGVIRIIIENQLSIPLMVLFDKALHNYPRTILQSGETDNKRGGILKKLTGSRTRPEDIKEELLMFFIDRLKVVLKNRGVRHDLIAAVFAAGQEDDLLRLTKRADALAGFLATASGQNLLAAYRRAANIVGIEEKKENASYEGNVQEELLQQGEEQRLYRILQAMENTLETALKEQDFTGAMDALSTLHGPVNEFFDRVTVNADDTQLRENRLNLLASLRDLFDGIADFSGIEG